MRHRSRPPVASYKKSTSELLSFFSIVPNLILISALIAIYYFIITRDLYHDWLVYIHPAMKVIIALQLIIASGRSVLAPILSAIVAAASFYTPQIYNVTFMSPTDAYELLAVSGVGFILSILAYRSRRL